MSVLSSQCTITNSSAFSVLQCVSQCVSPAISQIYKLCRFQRNGSMHAAQALNTALFVMHQQCHNARKRPHAVDQLAAVLSPRYQLHTEFKQALNKSAMAVFGMAD